jgi:hypothetical protein
MSSKMAHGTRSMYVSGCRCDACKAANAKYSEKTRLRGRGLQPNDEIDAPTPLKQRAERGERTGRPRLVVKSGGAASKAPAPSHSDDDEPGPVEAGVIAELASLSAAQRQPGLAEGIKQMARLMDSEMLATTHAPAMRQMVAGLEKLHAASAGRQGKLFAVASASRREPAGKTG